MPRMHRAPGPVTTGCFCQSFPVKLNSNAVNLSFDITIRKQRNSIIRSPSCDNVLVLKLSYLSFSLTLKQGKKNAQYYIMVEFLTSPRLCVERSAIDWAELARLETKSWVLATASLWLCRRSFTTQTQKSMAGSCSSTRFTSKSTPVETGQELKMVERNFSVEWDRRHFRTKFWALNKVNSSIIFLGNTYSARNHQRGWQRQSYSRDTWWLHL